MAIWHCCLLLKRANDITRRTRMANRKDLKVLHICYMDGEGGAAIGAYGLHRAMLSMGIDSKMLVVVKTTDDPTVQSVGTVARWIMVLMRKIESFLLLFQSTPNRVIHTLNILPTGICRRINRLDVDIVQLHWIRKTISIGEIAKIKQPVVWKMPDMWAFSGAEHYSDLGSADRFKEGYTHSNRPNGHRGVDIDRLLWLYKKKIWEKKDISIVGTSNWIAESAKESVLFHNRKVKVINNPIDLEIFYPTDKETERRKLRVPHNKRVILFGAWHVDLDRRKGYDKLLEAMVQVEKQWKKEDLCLLVFGATGRPSAAYFDLKRYPAEIEEIYLGELSHGEQMRCAYNAADVYVTPALVEGFGLTAAEALACGTPVVCFDTSGLKDIVDHKVNGYRAQCYDTEDLAKGISWVLNRDASVLSREAENKARISFNRERAVESYIDYYMEILSEGC